MCGGDLFLPSRTLNVERNSGRKGTGKPRNSWPIDASDNFASIPSNMHKLLFPLAFLLFQPIAHAQVQIDLVPVATGLDDIVDIVHAGDDRIFCVLQPGTIRIVQNGTLLPTPFLNITAQVNDAGWEQGLLGMVFDPAYSENGFFYVHYTAFGGSGVT